MTTEDPRCVKCGHRATYHGMTFCTYDYGASKAIKCDCDGWELTTTPAPDTARAVRDALEAAAVAIEAEAADLSDGDFPGEVVPPEQALPGLAGNSWWRTACEHNGLLTAAHMVRSRIPNGDTE